MINGVIPLRCDGIGALYQSMDVAQYTTSSKQQHFDLLNSIQGYIRASSVIYTPRYILGHQDDIIEIVNLDR